ncbi:hypothetical protein [Prescottella agglutinans]|uniref:DUF3558 domain-containing protein n=1 Tax=Prescottella agglutinans TaxID=1644129 RepID=A0ABT6M6T1_9NOCA|nr:hypothetical protein [Prescottella agglutinans]MDH6280005.1 hypothetical protein [Prescottella agglutinans]
MNGDEEGVQGRAGVQRGRRHRMTVAVGVVGVAGAVALGVSVFRTASSEPTPAETVATEVVVECPATTSGLTFGEPREGTGDVMVPNTPDSATVCRYDGIRGETAAPLPLTRSGVIEGEQLSALVDSLNSSPPATVRRCPPDFGPASVLAVTFVYRDGPPVTVRWGAGPCDFASNGVKSAEVPAALDAPSFWN